MTFMLDLQPSAGPVLVIGAGTVGVRRAAKLLAAGFEVTVVAPEVRGEPLQLTGARVERRPFQAADIAVRRWALVLVCTDDRAVNQCAGQLAFAAGIPVSVCDAPAESTFNNVADWTDGEVTVGVSTGGSSPSRAAQVRDRIAEALRRAGVTR